MAAFFGSGDLICLILCRSNDMFLTRFSNDKVESPSYLNLCKTLSSRPFRTTSEHSLDIGRFDRIMQTVVVCLSNGDDLVSHS